MRWIKIIIIPVLLMLTGCGNTHTPDHIKLKKIEEMHKIIFDLYQKLGYNEIDSINNVFDTLNFQIAYYVDSMGNNENSRYYHSLYSIHNTLNNYLQASNSYNEEIFTLEDNIFRLEYYVRSGNMSDSVFNERFKTEEQDITGLANRINEKRKTVLNSISSYYEIKPEIDKIIYARTSK